jgi:hypothetical protein
MKEFDPFKTPVRNDASPSNNNAIVALGVFTIVTVAALLMFYIHKKQQEDMKSMK